MMTLYGLLIALFVALYAIADNAKEMYRRKVPKAEPRHAPWSSPPISVAMLNAERKDAFYAKADKAFDDLVAEVKRRNKAGHRTLYAGRIDSFEEWSYTYRLRLARHDNEVSQEEHDAVNFYNRIIDHVAQRFTEAGIVADTSTSDSTDPIRARRKQLILTW